MDTQATPDTSVLERRLARERAARKQAEHLLLEKSAELYKTIRESEDRQRKLSLAMWASQEAIWALDHDGENIEVLTWPSDQEQATQETMTLSGMFSATHPEDRDAFELAARLFLEENQPDLHIQIRMAAGDDWRWYRIFGRRLNDPDILCIGITKDITSQRYSEHEFKLMATAFAQSHDAMVVVNAHGEVVDANRSMAELIERSQTAMKNQSLTQLLRLDKDISLDMQRLELTYTLSDQRSLNLEMSVSPFFSELHNSTFMIATLHDVTERKKAQATLVKMATHDTLTGLPNRAAFQKSLTQMLMARTDNESVTVFFIDLDGFKAINDDLGHDAGDEVLRHSAERLNYWLPDYAQLARWGGDEFLVVAQHPSSPEQMSTLARQIIKLIAKPLIVRETQISISASIGLASVPEHSNNPIDLVKCADVAMYEAKNLGKNQFYGYRAGLLEKTKNKMSIVASLRHAMEVKEFDFFLQPKCDSIGQIIGAEALARWSSPHYHAASPAVFVPLIEEHGLSLEFGKLALSTCINYARMLKQFGFNIPIAVNISAYQLMSPDFSDELLAMCVKSSVDPEQIELEVTESIFLQDTTLPVQQLLQLREKGFHVAIDDFGTGYSSLSYLRELPFDIVKIDRSFVVDADHNERAAKLLQSIIELCHNLEMTVVAEGIETQGELALLQQWQVECYQGYLLGRPMPFDDFVHQLRIPHPANRFIRTA